MTKLIPFNSALSRGIGEYHDESGVIVPIQPSSRTPELYDERENKEYRFEIEKLEISLKDGVHLFFLDIRTMIRGVMKI